MTALEKPKTLGEITAYLEAIDQGLIAATQEQMAALGALLVAKVDNTAEVMSELEAQEERLRVASAKLAEGRRQVRARIDRIKESMAYHMQLNGFQQIPGECWKVKLSTGLSVEPKREPTAADAGTGFIRLKYEWDKKALKSALEALDPAAMEVAELSLSASVSIDVNKGRING